MKLEILLARTNCLSILTSVQAYYKLIKSKSNNALHLEMFEHMERDILQIEQTIKDLEIDNKTRITHINNCEIAILQRDKIIREQEETIKDLQKKNKELMEFI